MMDLVVFSAAGRESLLCKTVAALQQEIDLSTFRQRVLSLDGSMGGDLPSPVLDVFTDCVSCQSRRGYFQNIRQGTSVIQSPFFMWLEDDWTISGSLDLEAAVAAFGSFDKLVQVRWPKRPYLLREERNRGEASGGLVLQDRFYTFNPHIARLSFVREAVAELRTFGRTGENVELAFSHVFRERHSLSASLNPKLARAFHHGLRQEKEGYHWHQLGVGSGTDRPDGTTVQVDVTEPLRVGSGQSARRAFRRVSELCGKAAFSAAISMWSVVALPFSREARAFVRNTWAYWMPDGTTPTHHGASRREA